MQEPVTAAGQQRSKPAGQRAAPWSASVCSLTGLMACGCYILACDPDFRLLLLNVAKALLNSGPWECEWRETNQEFAIRNSQLVIRDYA
jgi:hypothetical protein